MNSADRFEFDLIRRDQSRVRELVDHLDRRIDLLARFYEEPTVVAPPAVTATPPPLPRPEPRKAPRLRTEEPSAVLPPAPDWTRVAEEQKPAAALPQKDDAPEPAAEAAAKDQPTESLELRVGTYWMSRIGIVVLLTGLVFLGNYAYHQIVPLLGAWGKLTLLALAGGLLTGLGVYLERSRESTRNFGRVLLAGGAATLYYTAYAAHFVEALRVIESPLLGGGLLLALTAVFMWHADRRRSEAVAVPAVLLAYYTSAINTIGGFTLFSNLLLTAAAVIFLVRHRWTRLTFASLAATYGSYGFWHWQHAVQFGWAPAPFGLGFSFLGCYWVLFTAAVFVAAREAMDGPTRGTFLTLNNSALFVYAALHFHQHWPEAFWIFALSYGAVLLVLAGVAARFRKEDRVLDGAYLAQGLGLVTLGLCARLTGPQLAVMLAVESVTLLSLSRQRHGVLYEIAGGLSALGAFSLAMLHLNAGDVSPLGLGGPVALLLGFNAWWGKRLRGSGEGFSARAGGFAALALGLVAMVIWKAVPAPWLPTAYAGAACLSLFALCFQLPEVASLGQGFLALGLGIFACCHATEAPEFWWSPLPLLLATLGTMHWWQRQQALRMEKGFRDFLVGLCAVAAVGLGIVWMKDFLKGDAWMVGTSAAAVATLLYGWATGAGALAVPGQVFTLLSVVAFADGLVNGHPFWAAALVPLVNVALTPLLLRRWKASTAVLESWALAPVADGYGLFAQAMFGFWSFEYVAPGLRVAFFAAIGAAQLLFGAASGKRSSGRMGAIYAFAALALFWGQTGAVVTWGDLLAILIIPASLRLSRRVANGLSVTTGVRDALVGSAVASLWWWVTRTAVWHGEGEHLTAVWAALALVIFAAGLGLRERIYRMGGFTVLGLALGRLFFMDVWHFDALARIVSFLALGAVLLTLSFVYHRFSEAMRRWL